MRRWVAIATLLSVSTRCCASPFGHQLLPQFALSPNSTNLNHGSFGSPPLAVLRARHQYELDMELAPDAWLRYDVYDRLASVRTALAQYVGANASDVVFVENASHGVNAVLRSMRLTSDDRVLYLNIAYQMVKNAFQYLHNVTGDMSVQVNITFPTSDDAIVSAVEAALLDPGNKGRVKLASFSHITSTPSLILPVARLAALCRLHGAAVLIDGAHAPGQVPLSVPSYGADFYVGNGHKWLFSPKGSAFLWVHPAWQQRIFPVVISDEGQGASDFQMRFSWQGTQDFSAYLGLADALRWRQALGDGAIMDYNHQLAADAGRVLAEALGTSAVVPDTHIGAMVNVYMPACLNETLGMAIPRMLLDRYNTWVPTIYVPVPGGRAIGLRVSAQVYNELSDYRMLASALRTLLLEGGCTTLPPQCPSCAA